MKELLKKMGFKYLTGPLWNHEKIGIISVKDDTTPEELAQKIYNRGHSACKLEIRNLLEIKE